MAIDLEAVENQPKTIPNFAIEKVSSAEMQALWARICAVGTGFSDRVTEDVARLEATLADPEYKAQHRYVGFLNGTPVATSALVVDSGIAGIYAVATIPEARCQGIGRMMTVMPLLEARQLGYRVGVLQASPMGFPIYEAIGFQDVCRYRLYLQS
jgi:ribosomal protein S18 acetylase RimI-like enzyme